MKISVIVTGYLGATHAAAMAELGHDVVGIDVDESKIAALQAGTVPFHEPRLPELLVRGIDRFHTLARLLRRAVSSRHRPTING